MNSEGLDSKRCRHTPVWQRRRCRHINNVDRIAFETLHGVYQAHTNTAGSRDGLVPERRNGGHHSVLVVHRQLFQVVPRGKLFQGEAT